MSMRSFKHCFSLCLLLGSVSLIKSQTLTRLSESAEPDGTDHTGEIVSFAAIGYGGDSSITPRPWVCYTDDTSNVEWQFPNGSTVLSFLNQQNYYMYSTTASGIQLFTRKFHFGVPLYRGPDYNSPEGEYCCVRSTTNERKCVTLIACPVDLLLDNGGIDYELRAGGAVATHSCSKGYGLSGEVMRTCQLNDSAWSGESVTCQGIACPSLLAHPHALNSYSSSDITLHSYGTQATYEVACPEGYKRRGGDDVRTCTGDGHSTVGIWNGTAPICSDQPVLISIGNTPFFTNNTDILITRIGSTNMTALTCHTDSTSCCKSVHNPAADNGFGEWLFPNATRISQNSIAGDDVYYWIREYQAVSLYHQSKSWGPLGSYCCRIPNSAGNTVVMCANLTRVRCAPLNIIAHGIIGYTINVLYQVANYQCHPGYWIASGDSERTCVDDGTSLEGQWSGTEPVCSVVDCGLLAAPSNGQVEFPGGSVFDQLALYSCDHCYCLKGSSRRICQKDETWSSEQPICLIVDCGLPPTIINGDIRSSAPTTCGSEVTYNCNDGYILEGVSSRTCEARGEWSNGTALCKPVVCNNLLSPSNGQVRVSAQTFMSTAVYLCNPGYLLSGESVRECDAIGQWTHTEPSCQPVDCSQLSHPINGHVDTSSGTTFMSVATYTCDIGYNLAGATSRECEAEGNWNSSPPSCLVVDCGLLNAPVNGLVNTESGTAYNSVALYSCNEGYILNGEARGTCLPGGEWSNLAPLCIPVNCGALEAPANGQVDTSQGTVFKNTAVYNCALDYNLTGCSVSECLSTGNWSCDLPFCADNAMIQLKFGPTRYCVDWTNDKIKLMYKIMNTVITKAVQRSGYDIPMENIQPGYFSCYKSTTRTTYRTTITGTKQLSAVDYTDLIQEWVESGVTTRVLWYAMKMDKTCPVAIPSMDQDECE